MVDKKLRLWFDKKKMSTYEKRFDTHFDLCRLKIKLKTAIVIAGEVFCVRRYRPKYNTAPRFYLDITYINLYFINVNLLPIYHCSGRCIQYLYLVFNF